MKKALAGGIASLFLLSTILSACGGGNKGNESAATDSASTNGSTEKSTVKIIGFNKEEVRKTYLDLLRQHFPNYDIQYQFVDNKQFTNVVTTYLASGGGPDILEGADARWIAAGYLEDLTSQPFVSRYYDTGIKPLTLNGKVYSIPLQSWFEGIWYNKDIFAQNALTPPKSFDEWMELHDKLRAAGVKPQAMGAKSWEPMNKQAMAVALNDFYSKPENKDFDEKFGKGEATLSEAWLPAFKKWEETIVKKNLTPDMLGVEYDQALDEFATGKAAMWESGPWSYDTLIQKNPDLKLGMFPIPGTEEGSGWLVGGPGSAWALNKNGENKAAALEILDFTSTPEAQVALIKDSFGTSFLKGADNSDLPEQYSDSKAAFDDGHVYAPWANWGMLSGADLIMELGKQLQDHLAGGKSIEEVLKNADKKAQEIRDSMK
ncbi:ABC transporter substrate-binding protein [Paenibacillus sp. FSL L8-0499]|uniref:ABC transporter substrate-binding protein n=1 Tax=Paenibacillus sp. FSL L8-0499 TaxID=2975334 RepID=UPI0030F6AF05